MASMSLKPIPQGATWEVLSYIVTEKRNPTLYADRFCFVISIASFPFRRILPLLYVLWGYAWRRCIKGQQSPSHQTTILLLGLNKETAGIKPGKELVAACAIESRTPGPSPKSSTAALVQELNDEVTNQSFLTVAQLLLKMLEKFHKGDLMSTPVHVEAMVGPPPRTSIFLAPLVGGDTWNESPYPLTGSNRVPLGHKRSELRAMLHVRIRNGDRNTLQQLNQWLTTDRPGNVEPTGVSFEYAAPATSIIIVFIIPIPVYYSLQDHPAISFMTFVCWPESATPAPQSPALPPSSGARRGGDENRNPNQGRQGPSQDKGRGGDGRGGRGGGSGGLGEARSGNIQR